MSTPTYLQLQPYYVALFMEEAEAIAKAYAVPLLAQVSHCTPFGDDRNLRLNLDSIELYFFHAAAFVQAFRKIQADIRSQVDFFWPNEPLSEEHLTLLRLVCDENRKLKSQWHFVRICELLDLPIEYSMDEEDAKREEKFMNQWELCEFNLRVYHKPSAA